MVRQNAIDKIIKATRMKIGLQLFINRLRVLAIKPQRQFFSLMRRQSVYRPFYVLQAGIHPIPFVSCG